MYDPQEIEAILDSLFNLLSLSLLDLSNLGSRLVSKRTTSPVTLDLVSPFVEVGLDRLNQLVQG